MSTWLQLLRLALWQHPLQRALTVAGFALLLATPLLPAALDPPGSRVPQLFLGATLVLITPIVFGGYWWRLLSAPRSVGLAPHGRLRLLAAALGIALAAVLLWMACYAAAFLVQGPALYRPHTADYLMLLPLTFVFATWVGIGQFVASRSPAALLAVLAAWLVPPALLRLAGIGFPADYWQHPAGWAVPVLAWVAFGAWYLRARRIAPPGWLKAGGQTVFVPAAAVLPGQVAPGRGFDALLLGGGTVARIALQWLAAVFVLLLVQVLVAHYAHSDPVQVVAMLFATLSICTLVSGAIACSVARRSRTLWLLAGLDRQALYRRCEGLVLRVCAGLAAAFGLLYALVWSTLAPHPPWHPLYGALSLALPALAAAWLGLSQARRWFWFDLAASLLVVAGWWLGAVLPLFRAAPGTEPWALLAAEALFVLLLRETARRRWAQVDWPRGVAVSG